MTLPPAATAAIAQGPAIPTLQVKVAAAPRSASAAGGVPPPRYLVLWGLGWAVIGALVAAGIAFTSSRLDLAPVLLMSVQFAEVVGFTALLSARVVFPLFTRLPASVSFLLQVMVLFSATVFGSIAIIASQPLLSVAQPRTFAMIVVINAVLAVVVGVSLHIYDTMRHQIEASYRTLREKEAMEREIEIAREVQRELLPRSFPIVRGLKLAGACHPAIGVGGDYYDFLQFAEDQVGLVIADVSGKGIPAALLMAGLQASVRSLAMPALPPCEVNRRLNETLLRSTSAARYATLFYGLFDGRRGTLVYSNAGHYPPIHLGADDSARLMADGYPIGLLPNASYGEGRRQLHPGDLLILYTDGIIEAPDHADREYGEARLVDLLKTHRRLELDEIVFKVFEDLERWTGGAPPHDDATLVLGRAT